MASTMRIVYNMALAYLTRAPVKHRPVMRAPGYVAAGCRAAAVGHASVFHDACLR